ncbi:MAG: CRTAC1 family protein [Planctomycetota bacterium]
MIHSVTTALLSVSLICLAGCGDSPPEPFRAKIAKDTLRDEAQARGLVRIAQSGGREKVEILENLGTGIAVFDANGDGRLDIFVANSGSVEGDRIVDGPGNALYVQGELGMFKDETRARGLESRRFCTGVAVGDIEGDGDLDLFIACYGVNLLYVNLGDRFEDRAFAAGIRDESFSSSAEFLDYDGDGNLDLYVANYVKFDIAKERPKCEQHDVRIPCGPGFFEPAADHLYRGRGDGTFEERSQATGIAGAPGAYGLGVAAADFDSDGRTDIYVANDTTMNFLFRNRGNGTFEDVALFSGCAVSGEGQGQAGMGVAIGDPSGDGRFDILVTNFSREDNTLYRSTSAGVFEDASNEFGLSGGASFRALGWGCAFADFDLDGDEDLVIGNGHVYRSASEVDSDDTYEQHCVLRELSAGRYADRIEFGPKRSYRCLVSSDLDGDGDPDLLASAQDQPTAAFYRQGQPTPSSWLRVRLRGVRSNREGIGAVVELALDDRKLVRRISRGAGYLGARDATAHFGTGGRPLKSLTIRWPSGAIDRISNVAPGQEILITEGQSGD